MESSELIVEMTDEQNLQVRLTYILMLSVIFFWGVSWPIGRIVALNLPPLTAAFYRFTIAVPFFFIAAILIEKNIKVPRHLHLQVGILGLLQVTLYNFFFLSGLRYTSASDAVLIIAVNPTLTAIIASQVILEEKFSRKKIIGLAVAFSGVLVVVLQSPNTAVENRLLGNVTIFFAALTWATFTVFAKPVLKQVKPLTFSAWAAFYGWIALMLLSFTEGRPWDVKFEAKVFYSLIYLALAAAVYGNIIYNHGVKSIGASRSSIFVNLVPVFGVISSVIILPEEKFSYWYLVALFLILLGVYIVNKKDSADIRALV